MITFKQLLEMWEHPFSGKDYHDDKERYMNDSWFIGDREHYNENTYDKAKKLAEHYKPITSHEMHSKLLSNFVDDSEELNRHLINSHKFGENADLIHHKIYLTNFAKPEHEDANKAYAILKKNPNANIFHHDDIQHEWVKSYAVSSFNNANALMYRNKNIAEHMDKITSSIKTPHDMHVYTGTRFHPMILAQANTKRFGLHLPAFTSTSLRPSIAVKFAKPKFMYYDEQLGKKTKNNDAHLLKIHVPEGSAGVYVGHAQSDYAPYNYGLIHKESEFILPRNSKLVIGGKSSQVFKADTDKNVHIWHAKLVHDGTNPTRHMEELK